MFILILLFLFFSFFNFFKRFYLLLEEKGGKKRGKDRLISCQGSNRRPFALWGMPSRQSHTGQAAIPFSILWVPGLPASAPYPSRGRHRPRGRHCWVPPEGPTRNLFREASGTPAVGLPDGKGHGAPGMLQVVGGIGVSQESLPQTEKD